MCWDALDGSTVYQLIQSNLTTNQSNAARALMVFWYLSVGVRMALMLLSHLSPAATVYHWIATAPLQLSSIPTVDRTLQGLRLRSIIVMVMGCAEFYAAALRIAIWATVDLDQLQQDMTIKNILFMMSFGGAYRMLHNTVDRNW